jgi:rare lipoprotein A
MLASPIVASSLDDFLNTQAASGIVRVGMDTTNPQAPIAPAAGGYYLQFGAYAQSANAEGLRQQLLQRWPAAVPAPEVRQNGTLYRLYSGPFGSRGDAVQAAAALSAQLPDSPVVRPMIVQP